MLSRSFWTSSSWFSSPTEREKHLTTNTHLFSLRLLLCVFLFSTCCPCPANHCCLLRTAGQHHCKAWLMQHSRTPACIQQSAMSWAGLGWSPVHQVHEGQSACIQLFRGVQPASQLIVGL